MKAKTVLLKSFSHITIYHHHVFLLFLFLSPSNLGVPYLEKLVGDTVIRWTNYSNPASMSCRQPPITPNFNVIVPYLWFCSQGLIFLPIRRSEPTPRKKHCNWGCRSYWITRVWIIRPSMVGVMTCSDSYFSIAVLCKCSRHVFTWAGEKNRRKFTVLPGSASTGLARALPWCPPDQFRCSARHWWQQWRHNLEIPVWRGELDSAWLSLTCCRFDSLRCSVGLFALKTSNHWLCLEIHTHDFLKLRSHFAVRNLGIESWTSMRQLC